MTRNYYLLMLMFLSIFYSACSPNQFSSESTTNSTTNSTAPSTNQDPQYLVNLNRAILRLPYVTLASEDLLSKTKWSLLGYYSILKTTDGKGSEVKLVPNSEFVVAFSESKSQTCPNGMVCSSVVRNFKHMSVNTTCGNLKFKATQDNYFDSLNLLYSNLQVILEEKSVNKCEHKEDKILFEKIEILSTLNGLILEIDQNLLFLQNSDGYLVFKKAD